MTVGGDVCIWGTTTGKLAATLHSPDGDEVAPIAHSPNGRSPAVGEYGGHAYLSNVSRLP